MTRTSLIDTATDGAARKKSSHPWRKMKGGIALLLLCLCASAVHAQTGEVSHYVEFARTYGIVRYFSPNPYTEDWSESDWTKVCVLLASRAEKQPLETVFQPLAPTLSFSSTPQRSTEATATPDGKARYYRYSGSGKLDVPFLAKLLMPGLSRYIPYYKELATVTDRRDSATAPIACRYYSYPVGKGKYLHIQHALPESVFDARATHRLLTDAKDYWKSHQSDDKTLPQRRRFIFGLLSDKAVRVADLTVRWNIVRHFYPYYEEDKLDWDRQLETYLQEAVEADGMDSFESLLRWYDMIGRFLHPIKDGHLFVRRDMAVSGIQTTYLPEYYAAAEARQVNDTLLIRTGGTDPAWRILRTINNRPASEQLQYCRTITNAATEAHRDRLAVTKLFASPAYDTPFVIESSDLTGQVRKDTLYACLPDLPTPRREKQSVRKYGNGVLYIDATSPELNEKRFLSALTPDVKSLCFDLRGLPSYRFEAILAHLIASDSAAPATEVPINCFPFQQQVSWRISQETLKAKRPHTALPATFLCDASTVSWGETILMMVRQYGLGKIVGQPTAGTTGDMTQFKLPLFPFSMTGMRMRCMDGGQHHARGIVPDRTVPIYASDCMTGYDRTLHTALDTAE